MKIVWITHLTETGVLLAIRIPFLASFLTAPRTVKRQVLRYGNVQADAPGILGRGEGKERKPVFSAFRSQPLHKEIEYLSPFALLRS